MLNDWGIHHLHLGELLEGESFVERTGPLLFVRITENDFFMINVLEHGQWSNQSLVKIIHDNWPKSIESYKLKGVIDIEPVPSDSDIAELRTVGINSILKIADGIFYVPIGGGYMASKHSTQAVIDSDRWAKTVRNAEERILESIDDLVASAQSDGVTLSQNLHLRLEFAEGISYVHEENSGYLFQIS